jgi:glutamate/tyrosine decarboxylase-like PLP-dependent enzyme
MTPDDPATERLLEQVRAHAAEYLRRLPDRPVRADLTAGELRAALGGPLPDDPTDPVTVVDALAAVAGRGMTATTSARFFGFVVGGALPAAMAADMLTPVWDQNAGLFVAGAVASVAEEISREWLIDLFGLPADASLGFVTGGQMANTTALTVARNHVLAANGWDVERDGLAGGPRITVVAGAERHSTIDRGMRFAGLGGRPVLVDVDREGALRPDALAGTLDTLDGPVIVCTQMGNVNTGALDPVGALADIAHEHGAWVHVDGAFGLWAAVTPRLREQVAGMERADSWAVDAHKWLNVPYDSGLVFTAHPASHQATTGTDRGQTSYLVFADGVRDPLEWTPEFSRRGRGFAVWAALRSLGRNGVVDLVDRCCAMAQRFADQLSAAPGVTVHNAAHRPMASDVRPQPTTAQPGSTNTIVLNQVLVGFDGVDVPALITAIQAEGTCFPTGTSWRGRQLMRISVSNWQTDADDVDRSVAAILECYEKARAG